MSSQTSPFVASPSLRTLIATLSRSLHQDDPQATVQDPAVLEAADRILAAAETDTSLLDLEQHLLRRAEDTPLGLHLAVKLARSKQVVQAIREPTFVSVVFAVYKEHTRMMRPQEHPHGEDCLVRKIEHLRWLCRGTAVDGRIYVVDDGCPEGSGHIARRIVDERCPDAPVTVLFLEDAIRAGHPVTRPMRETADSQKGGSVVYGMWTAAQQQHERHVVLFTDADLSVHLGQTGLLLEGLLGRGKDAVIGTRRDPRSVVIKTGHRNTRGKLFIYLWKGLIAPLGFITDTQCGFKAFSAETVRAICDDIDEKRFAFDLELLLETELRRAGAIGRVPIAWIDSEAASTTRDLEPYLPMLRAVAAMYRKVLPSRPEADRLADLIESMTEAQWATLCEHVPEAIAEGDPMRFGQERPVSVDALREAMLG